MSLLPLTTVDIEVIVTNFIAKKIFFLIADFNFLMTFLLDLMLFSFYQVDTRFK